MRDWGRNLIGAALVGVSLGLVHNTIPGDGTATLRLYLFYIPLFPLAVLFLSRPLDRYGRSILVAVVAVLAWTAAKLVTAAILEPPPTARILWFFWGFYAFVGLLANVVVASIATWARRCFYPIYPGDHCQSCGYDLTGNVSGVCPECGIPTESARADGSAD